MKYIVLFGGRYPVKFHKNTHRNTYTVVREEEASWYSFQTDAICAAELHGMKSNEFTVAKLVSPQPIFTTKGNP